MNWFSGWTGKAAKSELQIETLARELTEARGELLQTRKLLVCSFCGKNLTQVKFIITGLGGQICEECVPKCQDILRNRSL